MEGEADTDGVFANGVSEGSLTERSEVSGVRYERLSGDAIGSEAALTVRAIKSSVTIESVRAHSDADGDGLSDRVERAQFVTEIGSIATFSTDPSNPDTDGDGVEVGVVGQDLSGEADDGYVVIERMESDPTRTDTDSDGLTDQEERSLGSDALRADTDDDGTDDSADAEPTVSNPADEDAQTFHLSDGKPNEEFLKGMVYGDWGYVNEYEGSRTAAYLFGWLYPHIGIAVSPGGPIEDAAEIAIEMRDCIAWNDAAWENTADCAYLGWELGTSAAKAIGTITAVTGFGAALVGGSVVADEIQDLQRVVSETIAVLRKASIQQARHLGRMAGTQFDGLGGTLLVKVSNQFDDPAAQAFRVGHRQAQLESAGLASDVAEQVVRNVDDLDAATDVVRQFDGLETVDAAVQVDVVSELAKREDALTLVDEVDPQVLRAAVSMRNLDTVATIVKSTDDGAAKLNALSVTDATGVLRHPQATRLVEELDRPTLSVVTETNRVDEVAEFLTATDGRAASTLNKLGTRGELEQFLTFSVRKSDDIDAGLERGVRLRIVEGAANGKISAEAIDQVVDSVKVLDEAEQVHGVARVLNDDVRQGGSWNNVQGALYELVAMQRVVLPELNQGEDVVMGLKPSREGDVALPLFRLENFDYSALNNIDEVAQRIAVRVTPQASSYDEIQNSDELAQQIKEAYGLPATVDPERFIYTRERVKNTWRIGHSSPPDPEFDGMVRKQGDEIRYDEMKSGEVVPENIQRKMIFLQGYTELLVQNGKIAPELGRNPGFRLLHRHSANGVPNYFLDMAEELPHTSRKEEPWQFEP